MPEEWIRRNETEIDLFISAEIISAEFVSAIKGQTVWVNFIQLQTSITSSVLVAVKPGAVAYLKRIGSHHQMARSGFEVQKVTVEALFLREIRTRFGKFRLGYLWAILEPSAHLLILLGIFGYIMHRTMPDISFPVFLLNGLIPFFIFSSISNRSVGAIEANRGCLITTSKNPSIRSLRVHCLRHWFTLLFIYCLCLSSGWQANISK